jgi:hypothetical protein
MSQVTNDDWDLRTAPLGIDCEFASFVNETLLTQIYSKCHR